VAREDIIAAAAVERFQLGRNEHRWYDNTHGVSCDIKRLSCLDGGRVPAVAEAQDVLVHRHDVHNERATAPPTERRAWRGVFGEPKRPQPFRECRVLRVRGDVDDRIDILRRTDTDRCRIGDEQAGRARSDEDEFVQHRSEQLHDGLEQLAVGINHGGVSGGAR
jgi:hypothetical protein